MPLYQRDGRYYFQDQPGGIARETEARPGPPGIDPYTRRQYYDPRGAVPLPEGVVTAPFESMIDTGRGGERVGSTGASIGGFNMFGGEGGAPRFETDPRKLYEQRKKLRGDIYQDEMARVSGRIQAITDYYQKLSAKSEEQGRERMEKVKSLEAAGLVAGTAASMKTEKDVRDLTRQEQEQIGVERTAALSRVYEAVDRNADAMASGVEKISEENLDKIQRQSINALDMLASQGKSAATIREADPEFYQNLKTQTGFSDSYLELYVNAKMPQAQRSDYFWQDGKAFFFDPATRKVTRRQDLDTTTAGASRIELVGGTLFQFPIDSKGNIITDPTKTMSDYIFPGSKEGEFAKSSQTAEERNYLFAKSQGFEGTFLEYRRQQAEAKKVTTTPEREVNRRLRTSAIGLARPELEKSKGKDGYVNPDVYLRLRTDYAEAIGDARAFDEVFADQLAPKERQRLGVGKVTSAAVADEKKVDWNEYLDRAITDDVIATGFVRPRWLVSDEEKASEKEKLKAKFLARIKLMQDSGQSDAQIMKSLTSGKAKK